MQIVERKKDNLNLYDLCPIKLTEGRKLKLLSEGWGLLTDYTLESVKVNHYKKNVLSSVATLRVVDRSGQITCIIRGPSVGLLFGLSEIEWKEIENLCEYKKQLFYRYFKNGVSRQLCYEQKLFYSFCATNQRNDVIFARFRRCPNLKNNNKNEAFLEIMQFEKCNHTLFDLYISEIRQQSYINQ